MSFYNNPNTVEEEQREIIDKLMEIDKKRSESIEKGDKKGETKWMMEQMLKGLELQYNAQQTFY